MMLSHPIHFTLVVPHIDVRMHQRLIHRYTSLRIDDQHLLKQVPCHCRLQSTVLGAVGRKQDIGEELLEWISGVLWPVLHVVPDSWLESLHEVRRRRSKLFDNLVPLINV